MFLGICLNPTHMRKSSNIQRVWSRNSSLPKTSKPELKTLYCTEWKQAHEADLPTELLQWQPKWWLMSQFFHSDGERICSLCMDPKWQWLTLQGVEEGGTLIPMGRAAMLTPLPSLSHGETHPLFTKPCSLLLDHDATAMSPLFYDPETTHTHTHQINYSSMVWTQLQSSEKFCLFIFSPPVSVASDTVHN